jgi:flagellar protein FlaJ
MVATSKFAYRIFGRWTRKRKYATLQKDLRKAGTATTADMYVSTAIFCSLMASVGIIVGGTLFAWIVGLMTPLMLALIFVIGSIVGFAVYRLFLFYPGLAAKNRAYKIDQSLPQVIAFIHAMSRSGANIVEIFRELSTRPDAGELRNEARAFMRDVEYLGHDPLTALRDLARNTPSRRLKELLEVLAPIVETGGDVSAYFASKWSEYQDDAKADQGKFISTLELYCELFITLVMLMPLLMLLVFALMGPMAGYSDIWLYMISYLMIPIGSAAFMVLVSMVMPEKFTVKVQKVGALEVYKGVTMIDGGEREEKLRKALSGSVMKQKLKGLLKRPVEVISKEPAYILFFSVPIAAALIFFLYFRFGLDITGCVVLGVVMAAAPFAVAFEAQRRKVGKFEEVLVDFLRSISSGIKSGLTLPASLKVASTADLGKLTAEVKRMNADIEWGASAAEALDRFERRVSGSELVSRAVRTIKKASEADEDIADVLDILMRDVATKRELERERKGAMGTYNIIMLIMFGIFLFSVYMITGNILSLGVGGGGKVGGVLIFGGIDVPLVVKVFMHASIIEAIFAGLVAGQTSTGDIRSGLKYSLLMMLIAYAMFALLILPSLPPT